MENNDVIKDTRTFPEEMHGSYESNDNSDDSKSPSIILWIIGLLCILAIVFYIGVWAGKKGAQVAQNKEVEQMAKQLDEQNAYRAPELTSEQRAERLDYFFNN